MSGTEVTVRELGSGRFTQEITAGRHVLLADEPEGIGDDAGPDPYALLLSALGACTAMTLRLYADRKGWPLTSVQVRLSHRKEYAADCGGCDRSTAKLDRIERQITVAGALTDDQRDRLLTIAEHCPVHRTLMSPPQIVTTVSSTGGPA